MPNILHEWLRLSDKLMDLPWRRVRLIKFLSICLIAWIVQSIEKTMRVAVRSTVHRTYCRYNTYEISTGMEWGILRPVKILRVFTITSMCRATAISRSYVAAQYSLDCNGTVGSFRVERRLLVLSIVEFLLFYYYFWTVVYVYLCT